VAPQVKKNHHSLLSDKSDPVAPPHTLPSRDKVVGENEEKTVVRSLLQTLIVTLVMTHLSQSLLLMVWLHTTKQMQRTRHRMVREPLKTLTIIKKTTHLSQSLLHTLWKKLKRMRR
jgi:hypothetical protein